MTEEEKFLFDLNGYILFPSVLTEDEMSPIRDQIESLRDSPDSLPHSDRKLPGGPASVLIDHPATMRILHGIIDDDTEKIRCENCFLSYRHTEDGPLTRVENPLIQITAISFITVASTLG